MTIADTVVDEYYGSEEKLNRALAEALNVEIRDLAGNGQGLGSSQERIQANL